jgi:hypothetical protein
MTEAIPLHQRVRMADANHPDLSVQDVAQIVVDDVPDIRAALYELIVPLAEHMRRNRLRNAVERPATWASRNRFREGSAWRSSENYAEATATAERIEEELADEIKRDGVGAVWRDRREQILARFSESVRAEIKLELTEELLHMPVKLYDGEKYQFGDLTWEQHLLRADRLSRNASGLGETTAVHLEAARLLREAGVRCLNLLEPDQT